MEFLWSLYLCLLVSQWKNKLLWTINGQQNFLGSNFILVFHFGIFFQVIICLGKMRSSVDFHQLSGHFKYGGVRPMSVIAVTGKTGKWKGSYSSLLLRSIKITSFFIFPFFFFFVKLAVLAVETQSLKLARQVLWHLSHSASPSWSGYFQNRISFYIHAGQDLGSSICASHVAGMTHTRHCTQSLVKMESH
jgi:hypothetical protein